MGHQYSDICYRVLGPITVHKCLRAKSTYLTVAGHLELRTSAFVTIDRVFMIQCAQSYKASYIG